MVKNKIISLYKTLASTYGKLNWWSHTDPFEVLIGAILVQNTNWRNAEKAINMLKINNSFSAASITNMSLSKLIQFIKPAGLYNQKAPRLKAICEWYQSKNHFKQLKRKRTSTLRKELLAIKGIGNETADAILLYAFKRPSFVIDNYTQRLLIDLKIINEKKKYKELQFIFHDALPVNTHLYQQYHALVVHHSQQIKSQACVESL